MPLTPEQRQRLQARIGQPAVRPSQTSGGLPPEVAAIASQLPQGKPYVKSLGPSGPTIGYPIPQEEMTRQLGMEAAKLRLRSMTPQVGEAIKRAFSRIDAFEGILNDLEGLSKNFRKGPLRGTYAKLGAKATGGGEFAGVEAEESEDILNYSDLRPGVAAGLYRAITGDDRISDIDAELFEFARVEQAVPVVTHTPDESRVSAELRERDNGVRDGPAAHELRFMLLIPFQQRLLFFDIDELHASAVETECSEFLFGDFQKNIDNGVTQAAKFEFFHPAMIADT